MLGVPVKADLQKHLLILTSVGTHGVPNTEVVQDVVEDVATLLVH